MQSAFTLMELVIVLMILGILAVSSTVFIQYGVETYLAGVDRQKMSGSGRFLVERLSRELRDAVPGSPRIHDVFSETGDNGANEGSCLSFRPTEAAFAYLEAPIVPKGASLTATVMPDSTFPNNLSSYIAVIFPESYTDFNVANGRAATVSDVDTSVVPHVVTFSSAVQFEQNSPAQRLYLTHSEITYCLDAGNVYRYINRLTPVLMGQNYGNTAAELMFSRSGSSYSFYSLITVLMRLSERGEDVVLSHEIQLLQQP
ncbi:PilW family protein [Echinimonas agarilytica]|uniref:Type II secretion system GspH family protein n=1 Tax=Echinimonas agarilytica TaxID=1215918 RepID=A0AA41W4G5_9GAMM|nr:type II secretion system GspH family protein [Echinimonas agarilytica]